MASISHQSLTQEEPIFTPHNTIVLWDLNGVILKSDKRAMLSQYWRCTHKGSIFWNGITTCIHLARTFGLRKTSFEEIIRACESVNPHLSRLMRTMSSCQKIVPETATIVEELHAQGYTLAIATNIGIETFQNIRKNHEQFFDYFSSIITTDTIDPSEILIKKSDPRYFARYQEHYNKTGKNIIFIDDDSSNLAAAKAAGMHAILFKNPQQLQRNLQKHNLIAVV